MLRLPATCFLLLITLFSYAQSSALEAEIMFQSRHVWRGAKLGNDISIEPSLTATTGRFSFNVWAALTPNNSYSEIDLIPSWQFNYFQLSLLDYYNPVRGEKNQFLNIRKELNRHSTEVCLDNYSVDKQRFKWMVATFLLGDKNEDTGHPFYSTYAEFKIPFTLWGIETEPFAGFTPSYGYYAQEFAIVNSGLTLSKELDFKCHFTIPLSLSGIYNPYTQNSFVTFATGIAF